MCALDLSIRPGASRVLDCGKVATVRGACEGKTKKRSNSLFSPLLSSFTGLESVTRGSLLPLLLRDAEARRQEASF